MIKQPFTITNDGLRELPDDIRDFPLGAVYGTVDIKDVPLDDFIVSTPLVIKDQGDTDFCSAYAVTEVSEDQEGVELSPEYQFYSTKRITGDPEAWGADLRSACKSAAKYGSVPMKVCLSMKGMPREVILDQTKWDKSLDMMAEIYKKESFFSVDGPYDTFDNIRAALFSHRNDKCSIVTGACWKNAWITAENGIIPDVEGNGFGHAFKLFGQKNINGELYIVAQLSNSATVGDGGLYYFNRTVTNKELSKYGLFMFKDISPEEAKKYIDQPYTVRDSWIVKLIAIITSFFHK